jgi:ribosomal protein L37AE/L43A
MTSFNGFEVTQEDIDKATKFINFLEKQYQEKHPCPKCGSHNVHIEIAGLGGGCIAGSEWCDDCDWIKETNTFKKEL